MRASTLRLLDGDVITLASVRANRQRLRSLFPSDELPVAVLATSTRLATKDPAVRARTLAEAQQWIDLDGAAVNRIVTLPVGQHGRDVRLACASAGDSPARIAGREKAHEWHLELRGLRVVRRTWTSRCALLSVRMLARMSPGGWSCLHRGRTACRISVWRCCRLSPGNRSLPRFNGRSTRWLSTCREAVLGLPRRSLKPSVICASITTCTFR
jgi:hypothetical protein